MSTVKIDDRHGVTMDIGRNREPEPPVELGSEIGIRNRPWICVPLLPQLLKAMDLVDQKSAGSGWGSFQGDGSGRRFQGEAFFLAWRVHLAEQGQRKNFRKARV